MSGNNLSDREYDDSDVSSLFSGRSTTTAPTEWSASEGTRSETDSDIMSIMSSVYVFCYSPGGWLYNKHGLRN